MSVYTVRLAAVNAISAPVTLFTVPSGFVYVLTDLELFNNATTVNTYVQVSLQAPGVSAMVFALFDMAVATHAQWTGRVSMNPGDSLQATASSGGLELVATGYQFPTT